MVNLTINGSQAGLGAKRYSYNTAGQLVQVEAHDGSFTWGYLGGMLDAATGLVYVGNGQYYDPATGRFLSRSVNPTAPNPYVPWQGNPLGMIVGPLGLLAMLRGKRKVGKPDQYTNVDKERIRSYMELIIDQAR